MGKVSRLEDDLLDVNEWESLYEEMPEQCKEVVDGPPECIGIGRNGKYGWFIVGSGQGPCLVWAENNY